MNEGKAYQESSTFVSRSIFLVTTCGVAPVESVNESSAHHKSNMLCWLVAMS